EHYLYMWLFIFQAMEEFELSFTFDEGNYENDFSADLYDFENMWQDYAAELHIKEENDQFEAMFIEKLNINSTVYGNERSI
ncbi:hypothetical protein DOY81_009241, partial [Sarcophaga bullata]